jgi:hypothetical protein
MDFVRISAATGLVAVVLIDLGDAVWWQTALAWKAWQLVYNFSAIMIGGCILGLFMRHHDPNAR